jgi:hypothetical protein
VRFVQDGFEFTRSDTADVIAFLLAMPEGNPPPTSLTDSARPPAALDRMCRRHGRQITALTSRQLPPLAETMIQLASKVSNRVIWSRGFGTTPRSWLLESGSTLCSPIATERLFHLMSSGLWLRLRIRSLTLSSRGEWEGKRVALIVTMMAGLILPRSNLVLDPTDAGSRAVNTAPVIRATLGPNGVQIRWLGTAGVRYRLEFKEDLSQQSWSELSGEIAGSSTEVERVDTTWNQRRERYYRVRKVE